MSVLESGFKEDMTEEEAKDLASRAILSGVMNDLGSGSNVDLCIIRKDSTEMLRGYMFLQGKTYTRHNPVVYAPGTASTPLQTQLNILSKQLAVPCMSSCCA